MLKRIIVLLSLVIFVSVGHGHVQAGGSGMAVIDADSGRLLFGTNPDAQLPIASLTKIWTAFVVLENSDLKDEVVISTRATLSEGSSIYLEPGETTTIETLLHGLMLRSGNDAAYALAEHVGGSSEGFVKLMNDAALMHGLQNTYFTNPSGLHHEQHLSSAFDTATMLKVAMGNKEFERIATTLIFQSDTANGMSWSNKHKLLHRLKEAKAGKTGFTKVAGRTLATYFEQDGKRCIVVTLNQGNDWQVHASAAEKVWQDYNIEVVAKPGKYRVSNKVVVKLDEPIKALLSKEERDEVRHVLYVPRKSKKNDEGIWHVFLKDTRVNFESVRVQ